jgi:D-glycero-D-manno-heptose 1,7-bisphosphate phosphatase
MPAPVRLGPLGLPRAGGAAVFLDRDGVLNEVGAPGSPSLPPRSVDEVRIVPSAATAVGRLRAAGFSLIVITNQPDVARGSMSRDDALEITEFVARELELDDAYVCLHDNADACECRKPRGGALLEAALDWRLEIEASWMIGDRWVDIAAGEAAGVRTVLLDRPYSWERAGGSLPSGSVRPTFVASTLEEAADRVLALNEPSR